MVDKHLVCLEPIVLRMKLKHLHSHLQYYLRARGDYVLIYSIHLFPSRTLPLTQEVATHEPMDTLLAHLYQKEDFSQPFLVIAMYSCHQFTQFHMN